MCTGSDGEAVLRAFFRDLSNRRDVAELLADYVVAPESFVRWWDGTLRPGEIITFSNGLPEHLEKLQRDGINATVTGFEDVGFQGRGTPDAGGWFLFGLQGHLRAGDAAPAPPTTSKTPLGAKGAVDCATGKLKAIVI
jgi:hypothetical protein